MPFSGSSLGGLASSSGSTFAGSPARQPSAFERQAEAAAALGELQKELGMLADRLAGPARLGDAENAAVGQNVSPSVGIMGEMADVSTDMIARISHMRADVRRVASLLP